ncbi:MAG: helix-turn-helix transcriptional regulator [Oscillospiraceae bacterium]|nr:helix-turn-helix transcriptional regulator [Oscillospiraceae bacterium]
MTVLDRILSLRTQRGWSEYRLSVETGIPQSTISSWFRKNINPTISSLEKICESFNITMSQFFTFENEAVELTSEQKELLDCWTKLTKNQQSLLLEFIKTL